VKYVSVDMAFPFRDASEKRGSAVWEEPPDPMCMGLYVGPTHSSLIPTATNCKVWRAIFSVRPRRPPVHTSPSTTTYTHAKAQRPYLGYWTDWSRISRLDMISCIVGAIGPICDRFCDVEESLFPLEIERKRSFSKLRRRRTCIIGAGVLFHVFRIKTFSCREPLP
jgi:hypothetical protein